LTAKDRRAHARLSVGVDVDLTSGHNFYSAKTRDISVGGLFIDTPAGLPIGTLLTVDLKFMKSHVRIECEVMWALTDGDKTLGVGVRFVELRPAARKSIEAFMALREPLSCGADEDEEKDDEKDKKGEAQERPKGPPALPGRGAPV